MKSPKIFWAAAGLCGLSLLSHPAVETGVRLIGLRGDVKVRRGLEEAWAPAGVGLALKALDTVLCGEASEAVLLLEDGTRFTLGGNAVLDVSDLRRITERQLFLFMMSRKIGRIEESDSGNVLHIANVSVVRGAQKGNTGAAAGAADPSAWVREKNGARALFAAGYTTNAAMKLYKVLERYPSAQDRGEMHELLGLAFEALKENGRAADAYRTALERLESGSEPSQADDSRRIRVTTALKRLKTGP